MPRVTKQITVVMEMTVPEANELRDALGTFDADHATDPMFRVLARALDALDEEVTE